MKPNTNELRLAIYDFRGRGRPVDRNIEHSSTTVRRDKTSNIQHRMDGVRAPWDGDWRLAIAEERVAIAEERLRKLEARMKSAE